jgi:hypothetical protein
MCARVYDVSINERINDVYCRQSDCKYHYNQYFARHERVTLGAVSYVDATPPYRIVRWTMPLTFFLGVSINGRISGGMAMCKLSFAETFNDTLVT